ncbi:DNA mismatch repair protein MutS [Prevotella corporis]|uniref:DNA mismatch repair protein MutS n=1 Tax=Prevotella corporis TaxID=28128 RepID=UPI0023F3CA08|nr:DNA mismatch repair protein MutS [Prevotella corporis]
MTKEIKPSVEQKDAIQKKTKSVSDKKSAKKLEVVSPILRLYDTMKTKHPDAMLLFRTGDSYTMYRDDAVKASKLLDLSLTKKGDHIEKVSFPHHALDINLPKLVRAGARVAFCDQLEIPQKEKVEEIKPAVQRNSAAPTTEQQQKFIDDVKAVMGGTKMVVLPDFGTKKGVVAGTDEDKGVSLNRVYAWNDNVSFAGSVPGDDSKKRRYYHPENIRPEFYNYLISEVQKAVAPQLVTENGQKVTSANLFESPKQEGKYFFYARLDGVGLHPKAVKEQDVDAFMKNEISVKEMFAKYYPSKMAKQLSKDEFDNLKLSDGRELTTFRVYKQRNETKPHFGEYMLYAEMGDKRFHATPLTHDQLDMYFDRTQSKSQLAEQVIGEQLHLKTAYEKYRFPENIPVQEVRVRKGVDGAWLISATVKDRGQTPEKKMTNNDLYSLFKSKTASKEQLGAKYLTEDVKELSFTKKLERSHGLKL